MSEQGSRRRRAETPAGEQEAVSFQSLQNTELQRHVWKKGKESCPYSPTWHPAPTALFACAQEVWDQFSPVCGSLGMGPTLGAAAKHEAQGSPWRCFMWSPQICVPYLSKLLTPSPRANLRGDAQDPGLHDGHNKEEMRQQGQCSSTELL